MSNLPISTEIKAEDSNPFLCQCSRQVKNETVILENRSEIYIGKQQDKLSPLKFMSLAFLLNKHLFASHLTYYERIFPNVTLVDIKP
jgi:hypothetical protein